MIGRGRKMGKREYGQNILERKQNTVSGLAILRLISFSVSLGTQGTQHVLKPQ